MGTEMHTISQFVLHGKVSNCVRRNQKLVCKVARLLTIVFCCTSLVCKIRLFCMHNSPTLKEIQWQLACMHGSACSHLNLHCICLDYVCSHSLSHNRATLHTQHSLLSMTVNYEIQCNSVRIVTSLVLAQPLILVTC